MREWTGTDNLPRFRDLDPFPMNTLSSAGQGPVNARMLFDAGVVHGHGTDTRYKPAMPFAMNCGACASCSRQPILSRS